MQGKLKNGDFFIRNGEAFKTPKGQTVPIVETENHSIYGKRYKIMGCDEWFEENCFEYIH